MVKQNGVPGASGAGCLHSHQHSKEIISMYLSEHRQSLIRLVLANKSEALFGAKL
jgi:hypothetical protein